MKNGSMPNVASSDAPGRVWTAALGYSGNPDARELVEAMQGEEGWAVVGGFAVGPTPRYPTGHVWVRKGDAHFDPTWSRRLTYIVPIAEYRYFALPGIFPDAARWGRRTSRRHGVAAGGGCCKNRLFSSYITWIIWA